MAADFPYHTVWIVGASTGLGAEAARRLAAKGCTVIASARRVDKLNALATKNDENRDAQGRIVPLPLDVTDAPACRRALDAIVADHGIPDLVVFCAGIYTPMTPRDFDFAAIKKQVDVNVLGVAAALDPVLEAFLARRAGRIAVVASVAGYRGLPAATAYGPTKAALINLCESLHLQLRGTGVSVQVINPGFVRTPLTDQNTFRMPHLMELEAAGEKMVKGLASNRFEVTFPWQLTQQLKLVARLPYRLYFWLVRRTVKF